LDRLLDGWALLDREAAPNGPPERDALAARIERSGHLVGGQVDLGIEVGGTLVGMIGTHTARRDDPPPDVLEIGIAIHRPEHRGRGTGTEAMRLFVQWLFDLGAAAVRGGTAETNGSMREVFERLGFRATGHAPIHGVEEVLYELARSEWERTP
jgi:RimJ/RimL family protein N-acetyltransferase